MTTSPPPSTHAATGLDAKTLGAIDELQLVAKQVATGALAGMHRSLRRGSSIEFSEHKLYSPGDDIRHIDWRAFAKTDRYHVKQFEDETSLRLELCVDHSASMDFAHEGRPTKLAVARQVAAALAYIALRQRDATGLATFGASLTNELPARATSSHLIEVLGRLAMLRPEGPTGVAATLDRLAQQWTRRSVIVVISDLLAPLDEVDQAFARLAARRHDISVLHVLDDAEIDFPYENPSTFVSMEDERKLFVHPRMLRSAYQREVGAWLGELPRRLAGRGIDYRLLRTGQDIATSLGDFLRGRARTR